MINYSDTYTDGALKVKPVDVIEWDGMAQVLWSDHCLMGSTGAAFHDDLAIESIEAIFRKGVDKDIDSYSGFYDNGRKKST